MEHIANAPRVLQPSPPRSVKNCASFSRCFLGSFPSCSWQTIADTSQCLCREWVAPQRTASHPAHAGKDVWCLGTGGACIAAVLCRRSGVVSGARKCTLKPLCGKCKTRYYPFPTREESPFLCLSFVKAYKSSVSVGETVAILIQTDCLPHAAKSTMSVHPNCCPCGLPISAGGTTKEAQGFRISSFLPGWGCFLASKGLLSLPGLATCPALRPTSPCGNLMKIYWQQVAWSVCVAFSRSSLTMAFRLGCLAASTTSAGRLPGCAAWPPVPVPRVSSADPDRLCLSTRGYHWTVWSEHHSWHGAVWLHLPGPGSCPTRRPAPSPLPRPCSSAAVLLGRIGMGRGRFLCFVCKASFFFLFFLWLSGWLMWIGKYCWPI